MVFSVMCYVYIIYSASLHKYYIGRTENLELRLQYHNDPIESRKITSRGIPWIFEVRMAYASKHQPSSS